MKIKASVSIIISFDSIFRLLVLNAPDMTDIRG